MSQRFLDSNSMPTSLNTHDYDGKLREKWFQMRPMLIERYLPNCRSFTETIQQIEQWLDQKYYNVKRIGRARRAIRILTSERRSNFDSRNEIDVEELLPILWDQVKNQKDLHDTFYEQLCDITGGSCSQGRSTRLFQFLFLFDLPTNTEEEKSKDEVSTKQEQETEDLPRTTINDNAHSIPKQQDESKPVEARVSEEKEEEEELLLPVEEKVDQEQQSPVIEQTHEEKPDQRRHSHVDESTEEKQPSQIEHESNQTEQISSPCTE